MKNTKSVEVASPLDQPAAQSAEARVPGIAANLEPHGHALQAWLRRTIDPAEGLTEVERLQSEIRTLASQLQSALCAMIEPDVSSSPDENGKVLNFSDGTHGEIHHIVEMEREEPLDLTSIQLYSGESPDGAAKKENWLASLKFHFWKEFGKDDWQRQIEIAMTNRTPERKETVALTHNLKSGHTNADATWNPNPKNTYYSEGRRLPHLEGTLAGSRAILDVLKYFASLVRRESLESSNSESNLKEVSD